MVKLAFARVWYGVCHNLFMVLPLEQSTMMKLLLLSDYLNVPEISSLLRTLTGKKKLTIGYISSAPDPTRAYYRRAREYYANLGAELTPYFDLESGFNEASLTEILAAEAIHLAGGNTYQFYYWIVRRNLRRRLLSYAHSGRLIIGVSAGAIILTPNLSYAQFCGDRNEIGLKELAGLGLVNFAFVPHVSKADKIVPAIVERARQDRTGVVIADDRDWIVVDGSQTKVHGAPLIITSSI